MIVTKHFNMKVSANYAHTKVESFNKTTLKLPSWEKKLTDLTLKKRIYHLWYNSIMPDHLIPGLDLSFKEQSVGSFASCFLFQDPQLWKVFFDPKVSPMSLYKTRDTASFTQSFLLIGLFKGFLRLNVIWWWIWIGPPNHHLNRLIQLSEEKNRKTN